MVSLQFAGNNTDPEEADNRPRQLSQAFGGWAVLSSMLSLLQRITLKRTYEVNAGICTARAPQRRNR
jgi:hypothetical protein